MSNEKVTVMQQLVATCREAHQARVPLIFVDTEEFILMDRLARECHLVDLSRPTFRKYADTRNLPYYKYLGEDPQPLDASENFTYSVEKLQELLTRNHNLEYAGASMEHTGSEPGVKALQPVMAIFHISATSWRKGSATAEESLVNFLRAYVKAYSRCRDLNSVLMGSRVFLYGDPSLLPQDLEPFTQVVTVEYPQIWELEEMIRSIAREDGSPNTSRAPLQLAEQMTGFDLIRAERFVRKLYQTDRKPGESPLDIKKYWRMLMEEKARAVRSAGGLLELDFEKNPPTGTHHGPRTQGLGGMKAYKTWVETKRDQMHNYSEFASTRGVPALKGVLLCGVPGCGKSEAAKVLRRDWGLSMLRMDIGRLMGGYVGDSERNLRKALALADAMSPVILWIDELEKGFAGAASQSSNDSGTFKRMFSYLLTWMQENTNPCFIFATANDISQLPPEFFRSGRFDALFSVYMPTHAECKQIFEVQMHKADDLRREQLKARGGDPRSLLPLFEEGSNGCYSPACLEGIMARVMGGLTPEKVTAENATRVRFLSGADIRKVVTTALASLPPEALKKSITPTVWLDALEKVLQSPFLTTQGSSGSNLDEIAACYVRLMRKNFIPVSEESQVLFRKENYVCTMEDDKKKAEYKGAPGSSWPAYDRALFLALKGRIQSIATLMETNAYHRISY